MAPIIGSNAFNRAACPASVVSKSKPRVWPWAEGQLISVASSGLSLAPKRSIARRMNRMYLITLAGCLVKPLTAAMS